MLKNSLQVIIALTALIVVGCTKTVPVPDTIMDDLDEVRPLSPEELAENNQVINDFNAKEEMLKKRAAEDVTEKKELIAEKEEVEDAKKEVSVLTEKVLEKRRKKMIKEEVETIAKDIKGSSTKEEIVEILEQVAEGKITEKEAKSLLEEKTDLSKKGIENLIAKTKTIQKDTEELAKQLESASPEEVAEILPCSTFSKISTISSSVEESFILSDIDSTSSFIKVFRLFSRTFSV